MPVSEISTKIKLASFWVLTRISPPFGVNFEALFSKSHRTCWSRAVIKPANPLNMRVVGILALRELAAIKQAA